MGYTIGINQSKRGGGTAVRRGWGAFFSLLKELCVKKVYFGTNKDSALPECLLYPDRPIYVFYSSSS